MKLFHTFLRYIGIIIINKKEGVTLSAEMYYTIETRLELKENQELKEYLDSYVSFYNEVVKKEESL